MSKQAFYNGILYQIEYQPELSNNDYTQHKVYHIKLGHKQGYLWSVGEYHIKNTQHPSMANAFHPYYKFTYDGNLDVFVFTPVIPYDD